MSSPVPLSPALSCAGGGGGGGGCGGGGGGEGDCWSWRFAQPIQTRQMDLVFHVDIRANSHLFNEIRFSNKFGSRYTFSEVCTTQRT